jgi:Snf7
VWGAGRARVGGEMGGVVFAVQLVERSARMDARCRELLREGKKEEAKRLLRVKLAWEKTLKEQRAVLVNMETMVAQIETKRQQQEVIRGIQAGVQVLENLNREMPLDRVEQVLGDLQDSVADADEVDRVLGQRLAGVDDAEGLEDELDRLVAADEARSATATSTPTATGARAGGVGEEVVVDGADLPDVPHAEPRRAEEPVTTTQRVLVPS